MSKSNQNKYSFLRLKIILSGIFAVVCSLFIPKSHTRLVFNSHFNTKFDDNTKSLFLFLLRQGYDCWFVINDNKLRSFLINEYGDHFFETNTFSGKIFALGSKLWFVNAFDMPVGGLFLTAQRKIVHLTHGSLVKNVGPMEHEVGLLKRVYYALFVRPNLSYSIATSNYFINSTAAYTGLPKDKILVTGFPRNDGLVFPCKSIPSKLQNNDFKILYAPTWRKDSDIKLFPFDNFNAHILNEFCLRNSIKIYIRLHPHHEKNIDKNLFGSNILLFSSDDCSEIRDSLACFDALITDYSSLLYDFLLLDRPMIFLPYDFDDYDKKVGFAVDYNSITPGLKPRTYESFEQSLLDACKKDSFKSEREKVCDLCNTFKTGASERLVEILNLKTFLEVGK